MSPTQEDNAPSYLARYTTASIFVGILSYWSYHAFPPRDNAPGLTTDMHGPSVPLSLTIFYLVSLPSLKYVTERYLSPRYDMKSLLTESMILYNVVQVLLNGWMVYAMVYAVARGGHPFIGSRGLVGVAIDSGSSYAVWVHYCDKYLEFLDTYFMILRGKMDQVSGGMRLRAMMDDERMTIYYGDDWAEIVFTWPCLPGNRRWRGAFVHFILFFHPSDFSLPTDTPPECFASNESQS